MKQKVWLSLILLVCGGALNTASAECQIQLSDAQVSYAPVTRGELLSREGNSLNASELRAGEDRQLTVQISCDRPTPLSLSFIAPASDADSYRYGDSGRATLMLQDVVVDGRPAAISNNGQRAQQMAFKPGQRLTPWQNDAQATGTTMQAKVIVKTWLPSSATKVRDRQRWQLDGTFAINEGTQ